MRIWSPVSVLGANFSPVNALKISESILFRIGLCRVFLVLWLTSLIFRDPRTDSLRQSPPCLEPYLSL